MSTRNVGVRIQVDGRTEVMRAVKELGDGLQSAYGRGEKAAAAATAAAETHARKLKSQTAEMTAMQRQIEALAGSSTRLSLQDQGGLPSDRRAKQSAMIFIAQDKAYTERAEKLRDVLDPVAAAQNKLNHELREYQTLANAGKITTGELAQLQAQAKTRFDETAAAIKRNEQGLTRLALASRLNLGRQGADVLVTAAMGMNPAMIALQQGPQILDALATSGIKARGSLVLLGGALAAAGAAAATAVAAWSEGEKAAGRLESAASGLGRASGVTAAQLARVADANNEAGRVTVGAAEDMAAAYVRLAGTNEAEIGRMISLTRGFAELTGVDAKQAVEALTKAVGDPLKTATDLTRSSLGLFTQAELDNIEALQESGDLLAARGALLDGLKGAIDSHVRDAGAIESAWDAVALSIKGAWEWLGRYLYRDESERLQDVIDRRRDIEQGQRANGRPLDARTQGIYDTLGREGRAILDARETRAREAERAAANQRAQLDEDRRERSQTRRSSGAGPSSSGRDESAAQARRDAAEADRVMADLAKEEVNVRRDRLNRWLEGGPSPETRATLERELYRIDVEARDAALAAQEATLEKAGRLDEEARLALDRLRSAYAETDAAKDAEIATRERADLERQRREAAQKVLDREVAALTRQADLARLRGDRAAYDTADRAVRVAEERQRLMGDPNFKGGALAAQALAEAKVAEEIRAQTVGAFREGLGDFIDDFRRSGSLREAVVEQLFDAGERWLDRLFDRMSKVDWSQFFKGGSDGEGGSNLIAKGLNFLFGRQNAHGTDFWTGGPTWVGERGPELLDLPRGSRVIENARSLDMMRRAASGAGSAAGAAPVSLVYAPAHTISGVDTARIEEILRQDREEFRSKVVSVVKDASARFELAE
ncbi:hypothetical protein GCM10010203_56150 [Actinomadura yumaensis]|mgnify:CR=1 FL=1